MWKKGKDMIQSSVVIIGSGIAGLYAALKIEQVTSKENKIILITKDELGESNSRYAQGGMVGVLKENKKDSVSSHVFDTLKAGAGLSEINTVKYISENSDKVIKDLLNFGVEFDRDENGEFTFTLEAAHSVNRVLHSGGDATGRKIQEALTEKVRENENITVLENTTAVKLLVEDSCKGVEIFNNITDEFDIVSSPIVILATGGVGQLYKYTTNPKGATGDGFALAYNAGADLQDMEFVQFHPTALAIDGGENRFLISEAVRGEGAKLVDADGNEFMYKYDERRELAPRDIVTRAIYNEMSEKNLQNVYLNATIIDKAKLAKRFPTISAACAKNGIDISKDYIPVAPAAHYYMGGVKTNSDCETSIKGLFAVGEVASTGLHGANRLASNSLLECVVCAYRVADYLKGFEPTFVNESFEIKYPETSDKYDVSEAKKELEEIMWNGAGILRTKSGLENALYQIEKLSEKYPINSSFGKEEFEFRNMITTSKLIITSALERKESRGAHCRTDFPNSDEISKHSLINKEIGELSFVK